MLVYIHQLGNNFAMITPVGGGVDPGFGVGGVPHPGHGLPGSGAHPGHDLPHLPGVPDNTLPTTPPPHVPIGSTLVLVRDAAGVWHYAAIPPGQPVPAPLPVPPPTAAPKG
jgi:hypothetical protein